MIKTETFDWLQEPFEGFLYTSKYVVASMASASSSTNVEINLKLFDMMKVREIDYANPSCTNIIFSLSLKSLSRDGLWHPLNTATNGSQIRLEIDKSWVFFFFFVVIVGVVVVGVVVVADFLLKHKTQSIDLLSRLLLTLLLRKQKPDFSRLNQSTAVKPSVETCWNAPSWDVPDQILCLQFDLQLPL